METTVTITEWLQYLEDYCRFLQDVAKTQNEKLEALLSHDIDAMEQSVAHQQAIDMQMKNYEEVRIKKQKQAGFAGKTLEEIAEALDAPQKQRIYDCRKKMQDAVSQIKYLNGKAMDVVETTLQVIDLAAPENMRAAAQGYTEKGKQDQGLPQHPIYENKI